MAFSNEVVAQAWRRANGNCECRRRTHNHHYIRCNKQLVKANRGADVSRGCWEAHHKTAVASGGADTLSNCEILCCECHSNTRTYGR